LIYSFYNTTRRNTISLTASIEKDAQFYGKIKSDLSDICWRQNFIRLAKGDERDIKGTRIPEKIAAEQVADYLQVDKKTIRNWTSEEKIQSVKIGSAVRYPKECINNWLQN